VYVVGRAVSDTLQKSIADVGVGRLSSTNTDVGLDNFWWNWLQYWHRYFQRKYW